MTLGTGVYYLGVSAAGNDEYDASIANSGTGGRTEGRYDLRMTFRAQTDASDSLQDTSTKFFGDVSRSLDGDADGIVGGVYDFWFETRPLNRVVTVNGTGSASLEGQVITITGANGTIRRFEFSQDVNVNTGNIRIPYSVNSTATQLTSNLINAINTQSGALGVTASAVNGSAVAFTLTGERTLNIPSSLPILDVGGRVIFVDKLAGPNADGSLAKPFNNIQGIGVANAFGSALPGDIVRIVGNGGNDRNLGTVGDNFAYEFGYSLLNNAPLSDGVALEVPKGVIAMVDAGAVFKSRRSRIAVGSSNASIDRSGSNIQVLGTPVLMQNNTVIRDGSGKAATGNVYFTSWKDETIGRDSYGPSTVAAPGDWGGIVLQRDVDRAAGKLDKEDQGIFLNYVNYADIRYGGGGGVVIDAVQQVVNPIQIVESRPTVTNNRISNSSDAAISAAPDSFAETLFTDKIYQAYGSFTPDYNRIGPKLQNNSLVNNSLNGLFIRVATLPGDEPKNLTVAGRFDDIDITHIISENILIQGTPGGNLLDSTTPSVSFTLLTPTVGGTLTSGVYNYKVTFVDEFGNESLPSDASDDVTLGANQNAVLIEGLPSVTGTFKNVRLYRSRVGGNGPFDLVGQIDSSTTSFVDRGTELGGTLKRDRLDVSGVTANSQAGGTLASGGYRYIVTMIDPSGADSAASNPTSLFNLSAGNGTLRLNNLPLTQSGFIGRRIYRSAIGGNAPYVLVRELLNTNNAATTTINDTGTNLAKNLPQESQGVLRSRLDSSLVVDPGTTIKLEGARIELGQGTQLLIEGTQDLPIILTSKLDDLSGGGGTYDTNNDGSQSSPGQGDWGGIFVAPGASLSMDYATIAYGGGVTRIEGTFRSFNALEIQQADVRVANSKFLSNANGVGGQGPATRFGRLENEQATVLVRGASPIFINNIFENNTSNNNNSISEDRSAAISIDANSMTAVLQGDKGRMTGNIDRVTNLDTNRGPLFRGNRFNNNDLNGLKVRGDNRSTNNTSALANNYVIDVSTLPSDALNVESVWDDTDIVHVLYDGIFLENLEHQGGLRLQSSTTESLVVKLTGSASNFDPYRGTGFTAGGDGSSIDDRVGGTIQVLGQPGFPVILTSLRDDTAGAGLRIDGLPQTDTNNDGIATIPRPGDWRGVMLDQFSNDRNVAIVLETESPTINAPGPNGTTLSAQVLGQLAANANNSDENLRLGFVTKGVLSQPEDVDTYSFSGVAGTEVWIDIDNTSYTLDTVVELLDANGNLLARSDDSNAETAGLESLTVTGNISNSVVNTLDKIKVGSLKTNANGTLKEDGSQNSRDAGMRVVLPGAAGTRNGYFFRVRSASTNVENFSAGNSSGTYEVQVRLREQQEFAGSLVKGADIRYATNAVYVRGLPAHSPLLGEAGEDESVRNGETLASNDNPWSYHNFQGVIVDPDDPTNFFRQQPYADGIRPQYVGNILESDRGVISIAGNLSNNGDVDFYRFSLTEQDVIQQVATQSYLTFDIDYADGLNRADTSLAVYRIVSTTPGAESLQLIYTGDGSNIADDQPLPLSGSAPQELSRGSYGVNDPFINSRALSAGEYLVAVTPYTLRPVLGGSATGQQVVAQVNNVNLQTPVPIPFDLTGANNADTSTLTFDYANIPVATPPAQLQLVQRITPTLTNTLAVFPITDGSGTATFDLTAFNGQDDLELLFPTIQGNGTTVTNLSVRTIFAGERRTPYNTIASQNTVALTNSSVNRDVSFNLSSYSRGDLPVAYFDYALTSDDVIVTVLVNGTAVANSSNANFYSEPLSFTGATRQARIDLSPYAGNSNVVLRFQLRQGAQPTTLQNVIIGIAERGEQIVSPRTITQASNQQLFRTVAAVAGRQQTGQYQLEIRSIARPTITNSNDRDSNSVAIVVPSGSTIDAMTSKVFTISDGTSSVNFEFSLTNTVTPGYVRISYTLADSAATIAQRIRDAINSPSVQSRFAIRAAGADGTVTGTLNSNRLNLFGNAIVSGLFSTANGNLLRFSGNGDENVARDQGQVIITQNTFSNSRDYGVFTEAGLREYDPRDLVDTYSPFGNLIDQGNVYNENAIIQSRPRLTGSTPGAARNLPVLNNTVQGGFTPGLIVSNNVMENGGLGGVLVSGDTPIWMITPSLIPPTDSTDLNTLGTHFGWYMDDGDQVWIDSGRTRVGFEFEDIAGGPNADPTYGSGIGGGNGWRNENVPVYYREDAGVAYMRSVTDAWGYSALETLESLRDSILGSVLVTNGTTQNIKATIAMSLLQPTNEAGFVAASDDAIVIGSQLTEFAPVGEWANKPALYLEGVSNIYMQGRIGTPPLDIRRVDRSESPQSFARVVNNTIVGNDGRATFSPDTSTTDANDVISTATQTMQGTAHNPTSYTLANASLAAVGGGVNGSRDVDFYQVKMEIGDRLNVNVTTPNNSTLATALQLFDSSGRPVVINSNVGQTSASPFIQQSQIDYTATTPGIYYIGVSSSGNTDYDPQSSLGRSLGTTSGSYGITLNVLHPQEFVITVDDPATVIGRTFVVGQVAGTNGQQISRTFEFTNNAGYAGPNIPIFVDDINYRVPDVARAIAIAITNSGLNNAQSLANGIFGNASPLQPVRAVAIGGIDGVQPSNPTGMGNLGGTQPGLRLFPFRQDGAFVQPFKHSFQGIGHDRKTFNGVTGSDAFGNGPTRADGLGTTERFVVIQNAAWVQSNGNIRVDPDFNANNNLDQVMPETGVLVMSGASPTIMNNVFYNVQTPIISEETLATRPIDTFGFAPSAFGSGAQNRVAKPQQIVIGGSIYQYSEPAVARNRGNYGIEVGPTNLTATAQDFNLVASNGERLFVDAQGGNYYPAPGARLIDSSIDSLSERSAFNAIKAGSGISPSPILAPSVDLVGQLRVDDPTVAPPQGFGANVFKDRGALDRADFVGPTASLLVPVDNDSQGNDLDSSASVVQLRGGVYPEFRIQLADSLSASDPFPGVGIDDDTVVGPNEAPTRLPGAILTISEDGRTLQEGFDYTFGYNTITNEIILTPIAGVWKNDRVYEITVNNRSRYVINATSGEQVRDGDQFTIVDTDGGLVTFEYDSGYRLQLPQGLSLNIPSVGAGSGGVVDGASFTLTSALANGQNRSVTFELDSNGITDPLNQKIAFLTTDSSSTLATKILAALNSANTSLTLGIAPKIVNGNQIYIGSRAGSQLEASNGSFSQPSSTLALVVPAAGAQVGGVTDGGTFVLSDGSASVTFEFDTNGSVAQGNVAIDLSRAFSANDVAQAMLTAINNTSLAISPSLTSLTGATIFLGLPSSGSVSVLNSNLDLVGLSRTLNNLDAVTITNNGVTKKFIFDSSVTQITTGSNNTIRIPFSIARTQDELAADLATAIRNEASLSLLPRNLTGGNIALGGTGTTSVTLSQGANIALNGQPGFTAATSLKLNGSLLLNIPAGGGSAIPDNRVFTVTNAGRTVTFEFDRDSSGASTLGNVVIPYASSNTSVEIAGLVASAINSASLGVTARSQQVGATAAGRVELGLLASSAVSVQQSGITVSRGAPLDAEYFMVNNGSKSIVFEFENTSLNNGITAGRRSIGYSDTSTQAQIVAAISTAINAAGLGITTSVVNGVVQLNDTPMFSYAVGTSPSLTKSGVAGGAVPVFFTQDATFTSTEMRAAIVAAINSAANTSLSASTRSGSSLFVDGAATISSSLGHFFLRGIQDLAQNNLQPTRENGETQFTILMPGTQMDFGNAPDPYTTTPGRYPTLFSSDGARHVVVGEDEVQYVGWDAGIALAGTFTLTHGSGANTLTTSALTASATAAQVQAKLEALSNIGAGNVSVETLPQLSGSSNVRYKLTFKGSRTSLNVPDTSINIGNLTGNTIIVPINFTDVQGSGALRLGNLVSAESDAIVNAIGNGDSANDGVTFSSVSLTVPGFNGPIFNRKITTEVTVNASAPGYLSAWFDFNFDGDWDDPNEHIDFNNPLGLPGSTTTPNYSFEFTPSLLSETFGITIPQTAPVPTNGAVTSFARFRLSSSPGLLATGLAIDGEVEDYAITLVPGSPPVARNDNYTIDEDTSGGLIVSDAFGNTTPANPNDDGPLSNDTDADGSSRTGFLLEVITPPLHAKVNGFQTNVVRTIDGVDYSDGTFTYVPEDDFFGTDTFTYRVYDGVLGSLNLATVTITVNEVNDSPIAPDKNVQTFKNQVLTFTNSQFLLGNTTGPSNESNQTLSLTDVDIVSAAGGTITVSNGIYTYRPPTNYVGSDSFTYTISDNGTTGGIVSSESTIGTVLITVIGRNTPPVARPDSLTMAEDAIIPGSSPATRGISRPFSFFLTNDAASDGIDPTEANQTINITAVQPASQKGGSVRISGGNIIYTPPLNFNGTDTFVYTITDNGQTNGQNDFASSQGTVTVTVTPVNDAPTVLQPFGTITRTEDSASTTLDLEDYFTDPDITLNGDVLTYTVVSNSDTGLVTAAIVNSTKLKLTLVADQNGTATIVVRATDSAGLSVTNTLTLNVTPVGDVAKIAATMPARTLAEDQNPFNIDLAPTYFVNPDNLTSPDAGLTFQASSSNTSVVTTSIVNGSLRLTTVANASGTANITVTANNGSGAVSQTFLVTVTPVNDAPTAVPNSYGVPANFILRANDATGSSTATGTDNGVLANDDDIEGNTMTAAVVRQPTRGTLSFSPNGTFTYFPNVGSTAGLTDSFTYIATDSLGASSTETTVSITFTAAVASPHQNPDPRWRTTVSGGISSPDVNADGNVSPIDALLIINYLNRRNVENRVPFLTYSPPPYRDVNGDMAITPVDVLQVINFLNRRSQSGNGEGEDSAFGTTTVIAAATAAPLIVTQIDVGSVNALLPMTVATVTETSAVRSLNAPASSTDLLNTVIDEFDDEVAGESLIASAAESQTSDAFDSFFADLGDELTRKRR